MDWKIVELKFVQKCYENDIIISKPLYPCRYDFITDYKGKILRVQVKSTSNLIIKKGKDCSYVFSSSYTKYKRGVSKPYTNNDIDFIAAHIVPEDKWYIIPVYKIANQKSFRIYKNTHKPYQKDSKYKMDENAWYYLK